jgi:fumarate reductase subunit C
MKNPHYRWYILFAATGFVLSLVSVELLLGFAALGRGYAAWAGFLSVLSSPPMVLLNFLLFVGLGFFAIRFLWVGVKIPTVALGRIPAPPAPLILVAHFGGLIVLTLAVLILFSGFIL